MKKTTYLLIALVSLFSVSQALSQKVAVIGMNHLSPDGISFVVTQPLAPGEVVYFTEDEYNNATNTFSAGESVVQYVTGGGGLAVGQVVFLNEFTSNTLAVTCTQGGGCGSATVTTVNFAIGSSGDQVYAYSDTDTNPTNGITEIYSVMYTIAGSIPASENPTPDFPNAIVVDGFASGTPSRTEFNTSAAARDGVSKVGLENPGNYVNGAGSAPLSLTEFTNLNLGGADPVLTLTSSPASVLENSGAGITYTFTLSAAAVGAITANFSVSGSATFTTDYTQTGAATFGATSGTINIPNGSTSASITVTPVGDTALEANETVILSIVAGTGYDAGAPSSATGTINNDDTQAITPLVAVTGANHIGTEAFSFVALDDIAASTTIYFTENPFDTGLLAFTGSEAVVSWTSPGTVIPRGEVIVVSETGTNVFTTTCSTGTCGATTIVSGAFSLASNGEAIFAYTDTDTNHTNGVTEVSSVLYTGNTTTPGGNIPTNEDPSAVYIGAVVVDNFPATPPSLTEYNPALRNVTVDQANFQNTANWLHAQASATPSTVPFTNIIIATGSANPTASVTVAPASVAEDSGTGMVYTFALSAAATADITINFGVAGSATFGSDYTQTGAATFSTTSGTAVITTGNSSVAVTLTPTADIVVEPSEDIEIMIAAGTGYDGGTPNDATGTITNDDTSNSDPLVAITGLSHDDPDGFSFVAAQDIPANTIIYFTEDEFDNTTLLFSGGEAVLQYISPAAVIPAGDVIVISEIATNTFSLTCNGSTGAACGSISLLAGNFAVSSGGEELYAYADNDTDPTNGVTDIYSVLYTFNTAGGVIPASQDPSGIYLSALVVDGFASATPTRTEYDETLRNVLVDMANFEDVTNWVNGQTNPPALSPVPFTNLVIGNQPPTAVCQDATIALDASNEAVLVPSDIDNGSSDDGGIVFLAFETSTYAGDITAADPTDELLVGTPFNYEASAFTVPTTGNYIFNMTGASTNGSIFTIIWNDTPIPNSGQFDSRPEFLGLGIWNDAGVLTSPAGTDTFALTAGETYYISSSAVGPGLGTFTTTIDLPIRTTAANPVFTCADVGDFTQTLYVFDPSGNTSTCTATVTVEDNIAPTAICQDINLPLDASGEAVLTGLALDNGSSDNCGGTLFYGIDTNEFNYETTAASPQDDYDFGVYFIDQSAFVVSTTGNYTFSSSDYIGSAASNVLILFNDTPVPNSGDLFTRPEYAGFINWDPNGNILSTDGTIAANNPTFALEAGRTYYMHNIDGNPGGVASGKINIDQPIITTAPQILTCANAGTVPYDFYVFDANGGVSAACPTTVTVEAVTTQFLAGAWDNGVPNLGSYAYIGDNYNTATEAADIEACICEVDAGATLTITAGRYLQTTSDILVSTGSSLIVEHQGSVVQLDDNAVVTNAGNIDVLVTTPALDGRDFMLLGSPMDTETRAGVFAGALRVRNHLTGNFTPNAAVAATSPGAGNWVDEEGDDWPIYGGSPITPGEGYMVMRDLVGPPTALMLNFDAGTLNNGIYTYNAQFNTDQNSSPNVIANPYASAIFADDFINGNAGIVDAVYFWEHVTAPGAGTPGPYALDYTMEDISIYNLTGGTAAAGSDPTTTPNGFISTGQGFGIKALAAGAVTFNNAMRRTTGNTTLRSSTDRDRIWLNVKADRYDLNGTALIGFMAEATDGVDQGYDAKRLATNVSLYSHLADGSDQLGIQARGVFEENVKIPMGFSTLIDETISYTITLQDIEGLNLGNATAYLIDNQANTITNLSESNYSFISGRGIFDGRFTLQFTPEEILNLNDVSINSIVLYPNPTRNVLNINSPSTTITSIAVYDLQGRKVMNLLNINQSNTEIDLSNFDAAVYLIEINTDAGSVTKRIIKE